jgi:hypothetical protein
MHLHLPFAATLLLALVGPSALAQDVVTLHSVTVQANDDVTVVYSKNFATCAHMRFSNATCTQLGALTHVQNLFCTSGSMVTVTLPPNAFVAGFGPGVPVFMVHGNNSGVASPCVTVGCNGAYGAGCAGSTGVPVLDASDDCPPAGTTVNLSITNGPPGAFAVRGFGFGQGSLPVLGCGVLVAAVVATLVVQLDGSGGHVFPFALPISSTGVSFTTQAFVVDAGGPQGFSATNGVLVRVR